MQHGTDETHVWNETNGADEADDAHETAAALVAGNVG